ncbi:protein FAM8A1-like [Thalassophryne amazonica]|uniref:protein FAM8A1-like n=1 Tax=Thalassophryne amazonica TaxID=390379 RepID=UPI0014708759|nr:protein FAM8A1-like [Thalassophryne amazonica]
MTKSDVNDTHLPSNMADKANTNMEGEEENVRSFAEKVKPHGEVNRTLNSQKSTEAAKEAADSRSSTTEYCEKLQAWMWQYYSGYVSWQSWLAASAVCCTTPSLDLNTFNTPFALFHPPGVTTASSAGSRPGDAAGGAAVPLQPQQRPQENGNVQRPGREYSIPSLLQRLLAEMVDFFILFFIKATIIISIMHLSGIKDVSKFAMHFIVEEIDEDTSMEELQKMMLVALVYRILVCFYEIVCIWGAGGATPGKFLVGLRVVTCDSSVLVQPNRVLVVPATNVSLSASTVRALNKNFSIAFFFPAFITLLFFQHNRTVYDMVAGTIVVKRPRVR